MWMILDSSHNMDIIFIIYLIEVIIETHEDITETLQKMPKKQKQDKCKFQAEQASRLLGSGELDDDHVPGLQGGRLVVEVVHLTHVLVAG